MKTSSLVQALLALFALVPANVLADPPADVIMTGEIGGEEDTFGWSVASAGDVNGDTILDLIVGAPTNDEVSGFAGRAYLFYGPFTGDLNAEDADAIITAEAFGDNLGISVASAGDVNGDDFGDLIIGARGNDTPGIQAGRAYLFLGPVNGHRSALQANAIFSGVEFEELGISVASAGDVNNDGFSDLILGAPQFSSDSAFSLGRAYLFYGPISGHHPSSSADAIVTGVFADDQLGTSVASAGDMNEDGFDDLILGVPQGALGSAPGRACVFFGPLSGERSASSADAILQGETDMDLFGFSVASAGDVNGDGNLDLFVGADHVLINGPGKAYLYYGPLLDTARDAEPDAVFVGEVAKDSFGHSVSSAGDVNADNFDDLLVGAWDNGAGGGRAGRAYLFLGPLEGQIPGGQADVLFTGAASGDRLGQSVASAGDLDDNGRADLIFGAPQFLEGDPGLALIYFDDTATTDVFIPTQATTSLRLDPSFPNPFDSFTTFRYRVPAGLRSSLSIYDAEGRLVRRLADGIRSDGVMSWDGRDDLELKVPSGSYHYQLEADGVRITRKVVLLRR